MTRYETLVKQIADLEHVGDDLTDEENVFVTDMAFRCRQRQFVGEPARARVHELWQRTCQETAHVR